MVASRVYTSRKSVYGDGTEEVHYAPMKWCGVHDTNIAAKRAYIIGLLPELASASDDFIRKFWMGEPRQAHHVKIVKVKA